MKKDLAYYLSLPYALEVRLDEDGEWFSRVRELPGCMSQGETAEEAFCNLQEVLPLWLESAIESGYEIPEPRPAEDYS
jgi:predicted RNase H-like HicB family nuclease